MVSGGPWILPVSSLTQKIHSCTCLTKSCVKYMQSIWARKQKRSKILRNGCMRSQDKFLTWIFLKTDFSLSSTMQIPHNACIYSPLPVISFAFPRMWPLGNSSRNKGAVISPLAQALDRTLTGERWQMWWKFLISIPYIRFQASPPVSYNSSIKSKRQEEFAYIYILSVSL